MRCVFINDYSFIDKVSGGVVYHIYNTDHIVEYYTMDYIYLNDVIWFDSLEWIYLGSKQEGIIRGNRYIQFKIVLHASSDGDYTPLLNRIYIGGPVRIGPIAPKSSKKFYINVDLPVDDSEDLFSTSIVTYFETLLF